MIELEKAAAVFKARKSYDVAIVLADTPVVMVD